jgi:predicted RecB family nuclease
MNQCGDGLTAMFLASQYYDMQESERDDKIMNDIIEYNKVDCSSVSELLEFLRNHSNTIML